MNRTWNHAEDRTVKRLRVPKEYLEQLRVVAKEAEAEEACGLLFGQKSGDSLIALEFKVLPNIDHSSIYFTIDPTALYQALTNAENRALSLVAIFHSHPMGAFPSGTDKKFMQLWPVPWLILSTISKRFNAFMFDEGRCRKIMLEMA